MVQVVYLLAIFLWFCQRNLSDREQGFDPVNYAMTIRTNKRKVGVFPSESPQRHETLLDGCNVHWDGTS